MDLESTKNSIHTTLEIIRKKFPTLLWADQKDLLDYVQIMKTYKFLEKYEHARFLNNHLESCVKRNSNYQGDLPDSCLCDMLIANVHFVKNILK